MFKTVCAVAVAIVLLIASASLCTLTAVAQTVPQLGIPPYNTTTGGPDFVNLSNLGLHLTIPVFSRAGRGAPFSFNLNFDNVIWSVGSVSGNNTWQPFFPFTGGGLNGLGAVFYNLAQSSKPCTDSEGNQITYTIETISSFQDAQGTTHPFGIFQLSNIDPSVGGTCAALAKQYPQTKTGLSSDGSALTINATYTSTITITTPHGDVISPPQVTYSNNNWTVAGGPFTATDSNGNQITEALPTGNLSHFTSIKDNLGTYAVTASGSYPSAISFTYTAPSGASASYTMSFKSYTIQSSFGCTNVNEYPATSIQILDKITLPDGSYYQFFRETLSNGNTTGRISSVHLPTGGTISYTYSGVVCQDGSPVSMTRTTPDGEWQYGRSNIVINGNYRVGSSTTTVTDPQQNQTVINFAGGPETERQVYTGSAGGTPLETIITCYNGTALSSCPGASSLSTTAFKEINVYRSLNGGPNSRVDTFYNTATGQVTEKDEYDFGASTPTHKTAIQYATLGNGVVDRPSLVTVTDGSANLLSQSKYTYDEDAGSLQPSGASSLVSVTCNTSPCRGNLTTLKNYVTSSTFLTTTFTHYDTGQVYTETDPNTDVTTNTYGACNHSLLSQSALSAGLTTSYQWNCTGGVVTQVTDPNNQSTYTNYTTDKYFWRPESAKDQLGNVTSYTYTSLTQTESVLPVIAGVANVDVAKTSDTLGRPSLTQTRQAPGSSSFDTVQQTYDSDGRQFHVTMPCVASLGIGCSGTPETSTYYDGMGRPPSLVDGNGITVKGSWYWQNDAGTDIWAPVGERFKVKQLQSDGLGRLSSVCEVTAGTSGYPGAPCNQPATQTGYLTSYSYATPNSLVVTQSANIGTSQTRMYNYDMLGRLTSESNPETGTTTYSYDTPTANCTNTAWNSRAPGNLVQKQDAKGNVTCYFYYPLNRLGATYVAAGPNAYGTCTDFYYDNTTGDGFGTPGPISNVAGRMVETETNDCKWPRNASDIYTDEWFSYNVGGEVTDTYQSTPHSNGYYHLTATYWPHRLLDTLSGLSGLPTITYGAGNAVDGEGRVTKVTGGSTNLVSSVTYTNSGNGAGQAVGVLSKVTYGTGDYDTFAYDPASGRETQYVFAVGSGPTTVTGNLAWNSSGTLAGLGIADNWNSANTQNCGYGYDDLSRLAGVDCGGNGLGNPGFESGNVDWAPGWLPGGTWTIIDNPSQAQAGNWYMSGASTTGVNYAAANAAGSIWMPVAPGQNITYGGWLRRAGGTGTIDYSCEAVDANHNFVAFCNATGLLSDGSGGTEWEFYTNNYTIPSGVSYVMFYAEIHGGDSDTSLTTGYFDSAFFAGTSLWQQTFTFDPFGNITKTGSITFQPGYVETTNRFQSLPGLSYDSDGNLLNDSFHTYTWDGKNQPASIDSVSLTFDGLGRMVEQNRGGAYTQIVYSPAGEKLALMNGQTLQKAFVPLPGGGTAVYNSAGVLYYRHADWLGSSRFASTAASPTTKYFDVSYAPYGEDYNDSGTTDLNFTGQNQDTVPGLYDFLYREYHPVSGRWVQPDPAGFNAVDLTNPQSWNQYAYVLNNPLANIDPDGLDCVYLNDAGDGPEKSGLDHNSDPKECGDNGGQWLNGTIQEGTVGANANTGQVWGTNSDGFVVTNDPGQSVSVSATPIGPNPNDTPIYGIFGGRGAAVMQQVGVETGGVTKQLNCFGEAIYPILATFTVTPDDLQGMIEGGAEKGVDVAAEKLKDKADKLRRWHKKSVPTARAAEATEKAGDLLTLYGAAKAGIEGGNNFAKCEQHP